MRRIAKGIMKFVVNSADPFIVGAGGPVYSGKPRSMNEPMNTLLQENHSQLVMPVIARIGQTGGKGDYSNPVDTPLTTVTSKAEHLLVSAHVTKFRTGSVGSPLDEPLHTVTAGGEQARPGTGHAMGIVSATLVQTGYGERADQQPRVPGIDKPLGTVVAGGIKHAVVAANLVRQFGNSDAADVNAPVGTICAGGFGKTQVVASHLVKLRGTSNAAAADAPLDAVSAGGAHHAEVRAFLIKYYGEGGQWQDPREPMHTIPTKDRIGLVTIKGEDYAIVDIGMRMLTPRELARAQGFPDSYILDPIVNGKPLSKSAQVRMIGNSVCPPMAAALVEANFAHERQIVRTA